MVFKIGEVARLLRVSTPSLRRWESLGLIPKPSRRPTDQREYNEQEVETIREFLAKKHQVK